MSFKEKFLLFKSSFQLSYVKVGKKHLNRSCNSNDSNSSIVRVTSLSMYGNEELHLLLYPSSVNSFNHLFIKLKDFFFSSSCFFFIGSSQTNTNNIQRNSIQAILRYTICNIFLIIFQ